MTDHTHSQYVEGCYRCDLSRDEVASGYVTDELVEQSAHSVHRWMCEDSWDDGCRPYGGLCVSAAEVALAAAAPGIAQAAKAEAWGEGHAAGCTDPYAKYGECGCGPNPYREGAES